MENLNENLKELLVLSNKCIDPTDLIDLKDLKDPIDLKVINTKLEELIDNDTNFLKNIKKIEIIFDNLFKII
tara:strand:- start:53 stop:268 length:216 start_codon:yes stop_codon:yes gene_type:complete